MHSQSANTLRCVDINEETTQTIITNTFFFANSQVHIGVGGGAVDNLAKKIFGGKMTKIFLNQQLVCAHCHFSSRSKFMATKGHKNELSLHFKN